MAKVIRYNMTENLSLPVTEVRTLGKFRLKLPAQYGGRAGKFGCGLGYRGAEEVITGKNT